MYLSKTPLDLTVIYYTSNYLEEQNPVFVENTKKQLLKAIGDHPLISVSHKPMNFGQNICVGDIGRSHRNIYWQMLVGAKAAKTKYVAMAEDDILYSYEHFHTYTPKENKFAFDMQKLSLFTWGEPIFTFRTKRMVVNQLVAPREMLIEALEERFARVPELHKLGKTDDWINSRWGDPGRYENLLGVTVREKEEFYSQVPSIVFSHPKAFGYETNQGKKKRLGDIRMIEIPFWGRAEDVLKLHNNSEEFYGKSEACEELAKDLKAQQLMLENKVNEQKKLWDKLAKENSKYYINSDHGKGINEKQFEHSGLVDSRKYIYNDEFIKPGDDKVFLEIGCGSGRILNFLPAFFSRIIGIDISGEMIKQARERLKWINNLEMIDLIETDGYLIPLEDNYVNVAFSYLVFQHMKTKEMVESNFKEVYRVLKPGGIFKVRIRTDEVKSMDKWWAGIAYTEQSIGLLIKEVGFEVLKTEKVENYGLWLWLKKGSDAK